jgi:hypothetical protein
LFVFSCSVRTDVYSLGASVMKQNRGPMAGDDATLIK